MPALENLARANRWLHAVIDDTTMNGLFDQDAKRYRIAWSSKMDGAILATVIHWPFN